MGRPDPDQERMKVVLEAYEKSRKTYGYRRIQIWIEREYGSQDQSQGSPQADEEAQYSLCGEEEEPYRLIYNRMELLKLIPISWARTSEQRTQSKMGHGYYLYPYPARICLSGGHQGLL